jgi:hypothetical protein
MKNRAKKQALKDSIMNTDADKNMESTFITNPTDGLLNDYIIMINGLGKYTNEMDTEESPLLKIKRF